MISILHKLWIVNSKTKTKLKIYNRKPHQLKFIKKKKKEYLTDFAAWNIRSCQPSEIDYSQILSPSRDSKNKAVQIVKVSKLPQSGINCPPPLPKTAMQLAIPTVASTLEIKGQVTVQVYTPSGAQDQVFLRA